MVEVRILGPLQVVTDDGSKLRLGPRQTKILAALVLAEGRAMSVESLIDVVWMDFPPSTARRQIHNAIWILRKHVPVVAEANGYRLPADDIETDVRQFNEATGLARAATATGRVVPAVEHLEAALRLWRGAALAGCESLVLAAKATNLDEQRLEAILQHVDLRLRSGSHQDVIGELTELVATHPTREGLVARLMTALHETGRRADALAAYQQLRSRLAEQLGIDPAAELQQLHLSMLRDDTVNQEVQTVVPRQLPAAIGHFVGRKEQLRQLTRILKAAGESRPTVIAAICGTAGVGKTALAVHWCQAIADQFPDGQLYLNLRGFDASAEPPTTAETIRTLLDALQVPANLIPTSLAAQIGLYRSVIAGRKMLLLLDNASHPDQVRPLLPGSGCVVVVTSRNHLTGLAAAQGAHLMVLGLFSHDESRELLSRHLGPGRLTENPSAVDELAAHCARLPLALSIVAVRAAVQPSLTLEALCSELADAQRRLDSLDTADPQTQIRAVFSWSYDRVSVAAARLFRLIGLHPGPDITVGCASSLTATQVSAAHLALSELTHANLLVEHPAGRYAMHELLRVYASEVTHTHDTEHERRLALTRMYDHYLHTAYAADRLRDSHRDEIALAPAQPGTVVETLADDRAALAWFIAEHRTLVSAIPCAAVSGFDVHTWQLAWSTATYLYRQGHWHDHVLAQSAALAAAQRLGDLVAQSLAHISLSGIDSRLDRLPEAQCHSQEALEITVRTGDPVARARAHRNLAFVLSRRGRLPEAVEHAGHALALYRQAGIDAGRPTRSTPWAGTKAFSAPMTRRWTCASRR